MRLNLLTIVLVTVCLMTAGCRSQPSRTEVTNPTTPADDAKPNSDAVPEVIAIPSQFERIIVLRFKYGTDLLDGLESMVKALARGGGTIMISLRARILHRSLRTAPLFTRRSAGPRTVREPSSGA